MPHNEFFVSGYDFYYDEEESDAPLVLDDDDEFFEHGRDEITYTEADWTPTEPRIVRGLLND